MKTLSTKKKADLEEKKEKRNLKERKDALLSQRFALVMMCGLLLMPSGGALVKCRKVGAANWGNKSKKKEGLGVR